MKKITDEGPRVLDDVPIFQGIPPEGLMRLQEAGQIREFPVGSELMRQGDPSDSMHVILSGEVEVRRSHPDLLDSVVFAVLRRGEVVGEIGVLDGEPRTATVVATLATRTLELSADQVGEIILQYPATTRILLRTVSWRLRNTDELATEIARRREGGKGS